MHVDLLLLGDVLCGLSDVLAGRIQGAAVAIADLQADRTRRLEKAANQDLSGIATT